jgi:hypothetical protein
MSPAGDENAGSKVEVARSRNWKPGAPPTLRPIRALLWVASIATPQFVQEPPEKPIEPLPPLASVLLREVPESR